MTDFLLIMHVAESSKASQMIFWCKLQNSTKVNGVLSIYTGQIFFEQFVTLMYEHWKE